MTEYIQVQTTVEQREDAELLARALVDRRLAACVQLLGPLTSTYRWHGTVETATEWLCLIKTRDVVFDELVEAIEAVHPYEMPQIVALPIVRGSRAYLDWLATEVRPAG